MQLSRLTCLSLVVGLLLSPQLPSYASGERVSIPIVNAGSKDDDFRMFRSHFNDWVINISEDNYYSGQASYVRNLRIVDRSAEFSSHRDMENYWRQGDALQILLGSISKDAQDAFFIRTRIYLGGLQGDFPSPSVLVEVPYRARDYADARDSHVAILYYGLAMDAERVDPLNKALIAKFLKSAKDRVIDIKRRRSLSSAPGSVVFALESSIDAATRRLLAQR